MGSNGEGYANANLRRKEARDGYDGRSKKSTPDYSWNGQAEMGLRSQVFVGNDNQDELLQWRYQQYRGGKCRVERGRGIRSVKPEEGSWSGETEDVTVMRCMCQQNGHPPPYSSQGHSLSSIAVGDQNSEFGQSAFEGESGEDLYRTVRKPGRVLASHMVTSKSTLMSLEQPKYE
jgi:hypothetical protein